MAKYADENDFFTLSFEEHHGADDGWSPTPLTNAAMVVGATKNVRIIVQALLVPLHDPIRLAEQIAVLDLASGGRVSVVAGLGYRPEEYEAGRQVLEGPRQDPRRLADGDPGRLDRRGVRVRRPQARVDPGARSRRRRA